MVSKHSSQSRSKQRYLLPATTGRRDCNLCLSPKPQPSLWRNTEIQQAFSLRKGFRIWSSSPHEISREICCFLSLLTPARPTRKPHSCPSHVLPRFSLSASPVSWVLLTSPSLRQPRYISPVCPVKVKRAPAGLLRGRAPRPRFLGPLRHSGKPQIPRTGCWQRCPAGGAAPRCPGQHGPAAPPRALPKRGSCARH